MWCKASSSLEIGDAAPAEARFFSQRLLSQTGCCAVGAEQRSERLALDRVLLHSDVG
jgi:hypothetical protein